MKRDFRRSEVPNLNENFRDYSSGTSLQAWWNFGEVNTEDYKLYNKAKSSPVSPLVYSSTDFLIPKTSEGSPYKARTDLKSFYFQKLRKQSYRLETASEIPATQSPITIAGWAKISELGGDGDATLGIFTRCRSGLVYTEDVTGTYKFSYRPSLRKFTFGLSGYVGASTTTLVLTTPALSDMPQVSSIKDGQWFHYAVVISSADQGYFKPSSDPRGALIKNYIKIYINGKLMDCTVTGGNSGGGAELSSDFQFGIATALLIFGKGPSDRNILQDFSNVELHEAAVWSKELLESEIRSLYEAAIMFVGSGAISLPPKVQLNNITNNRIVNPLNMSVVTDTEKINSSSIFDDNTAREFGNSIFINYSAKVPVLSYTKRAGGDISGVKLNQLISASVASPSLPPDIYITGSLGSACSSSDYGVSSGSGVWGEESIDRADFLAISYGTTLNRQSNKLNPFGNPRKNFNYPSYGRGFSWDVTKTPAPFTPFIDNTVSFDKKEDVWERNSLIGPSFTVGAPLQRPGGQLPADRSRRDRAIIAIDIDHAASNVILTRYDAGAEMQDKAGYDGAGLRKDRTGFRYFNWKSKGFEQIGDTLATGETGLYHFRLVSDRYYRWNWLTGTNGSVNEPSWPSGDLYVSNSYYDTTPAGRTVPPSSPSDSGMTDFSINQKDSLPGQAWRKCSPPVAGFNNIPRQFFPGYKDTEGVFRDKDRANKFLKPAFLESNKYAGHPMVQYGAPQDMRYFADTPFRLDLSRFIKAPFLLEKVMLEVEVEGVRTYSNIDRYPATAYPQDDYVFFLYRQDTQSPNSGSATSNLNLRNQLSSSNRYLVCSGNVAVYADDCFDMQYGKTASIWSPARSYKEQFGKDFFPVNTPSVALKLDKLREDGNPFGNPAGSPWSISPNFIKPSKRQVFRGSNPSASENTVAYQVGTGQQKIIVTMTPAIPPKRRYGRFWEHTQVQRVVSGNYMMLSKQGRLWEGTGGGANIPHNPYAHFKDSLGYNINKTILFKSAAFSEFNADVNRMLAPVDISSSLNYRWIAPGWDPTRGAYQSPLPSNDSGGKTLLGKAYDNYVFVHFNEFEEVNEVIEPAAVPPDYSRAQPVFATWPGGTSYRPSPQIYDPKFRDSLKRSTYRVGSGLAREAWLGQRFPYGFNSSTTLTPLGVITSSNPTHFAHSGEPFSATPNKQPNSFFEINQINEVNTQRYFSAELYDSRTRNSPFSHKYLTYKPVFSASFYCAADASAHLLTSSLEWNSERLVFDPPESGMQRETGYLLFPGDDLILGVEAAIAAPSYYSSGSITCLTGSFLNIVAGGKIKLQLIGSYLKEDKRVANVSSQQQLLNANVSLAIGIEPVVDQYQIEPRESYIGTYISKHLTGSLITDDSPPLPIQPGFITKKTPPTSGFITGKTILAWPGMANYRAYRKVQATVLDENFGDTNSFQRFIKCSQQGKAYYDTLVPNTNELWRGYSPNEALYWVGATPQLGATRSRGPDGVLLTGHKFACFGAISRADLEAIYPYVPSSIDPKNPRQSEVFVDSYNENWWRSYPYEPKYTRKETDGSGWTVKKPLRLAVHSWEGVETAHDGHGPVVSLGNVTVGIVPPYNLSYAKQDLPNPASARTSTQTDWLSLPGLIMCSPKKLNFGLVPHRGTSALPVAASPEIKTFDMAHSGSNHRFWHRQDDVDQALKYLFGIKTNNEFFSMRTFASSSAAISCLESRKYFTGEKGATLLLGYSTPTAAPYYRQKYMLEKPRGWKYGLMNPLPLAPSAVFRSDRYGQFRDMLEQRKDALLYDYGEESVDFDTQPVVATFMEPAWKTNLSSPGEMVPADPLDTRCSNLDVYCTSSLPFYEPGVDYPYGKNRSESVDSVSDFILVTAD